MSDSLQQYSYSLLCLRVAAECRNFSDDVPEEILKFHFLQMADIWTELAERPRLLH
jgi:hypothetical protein